MMDSYEAFFDEYIAFMKKYEANPGDLELLGEYADYINKYSDYLAKLSAVEQDDRIVAERFQSRRVDGFCKACGDRFITDGQ